MMVYGSSISQAGKVSALHKQHIARRPTAQNGINPALSTAQGNDPSRVTIELIGSYAARHVETGETLDLTSSRNRRTTKGPISPLCRRLIALGLDPELRVHIIRKALDRDGFIPVFRRDRTLKAWAEVDCIESEKKSLRVVRYRSFQSAESAFQKRSGSGATDLPENT